MATANLPTKRTRLRAVYLTDTERDLLVSGMRVLLTTLANDLPAYSSERVANFAKSFTCRRIDEVIELLHGPDKTAEAGGPDAL